MYTYLKSRDTAPRTGFRESVFIAETSPPRDIKPLAVPALGSAALRLHGTWTFR